MGKFKSSRILVVMVLGLVLALGSACAGKRTSGIGFSSIVIAAPPEKVFAYMDDTKHWTEMNPAMKKIWEVEGHGLGASWRWEQEALGLKNEGKSVWAEYVPNQKVVEVATSKWGDYVATWILVPQKEEIGRAHV